MDAGPKNNRDECGFYMRQEEMCNREREKQRYGIKSGKHTVPPGHNLKELYDRFHKNWQEDCIYFHRNAAWTKSSIM